MSVQKYARYASRKYPAINKRARVYVPAVKQLASDVMYLKGLINSEPKNHYYSATGNFDWNGVILALNNVPQGDTGTSRDGDRVLPKYQTIHAHINKDTAGRMHTTIRYIIFRWWGESPNAVGVAPVAADIIGALGTVYAPLSFLVGSITGSKGDRNRRIEIARTGTFTLDNVSKTSVDIKETIKLNGKDKQIKEHMEFYDGTTAPPVSGGFFMLFVQDSVTAADVSYTLDSHLVFYDN